MKFNFLKFGKKSLPTLKSLRPRIFDTDSFWFLSLGVSLIIFLIMALVGFRLFYSQYFESYKVSDSAKNVESLINIDKLKGALQKRSDFINKETPVSTDPSL
jgi:hypothetical protein